MFFRKPHDDLRRSRQLRAILHALQMASDRAEKVTTSSSRHATRIPLFAASIAEQAGGTQSQQGQGTGRFGNRTRRNRRIGIGFISPAINRQHAIGQIEVGLGPAVMQLSGVVFKPETDVGMVLDKNTPLRRILKHRGSPWTIVPSHTC